MSGPLSFSSFQFPGDDEGHLQRECARTERSRGGKSSMGSSHQFVYFPFVRFEVRFLFQSKRTAVPSGTDETTRRQLPESMDQQVPHPSAANAVAHRRGCHLPPRVFSTRLYFRRRGYLQHGGRGYCVQLSTLTTTATVIFLFADRSHQLCECFASKNMVLFVSSLSSSSTSPSRMRTRRFCAFSSRSPLS